MFNGKVLQLFIKYCSQYCFVGLVVRVALMLDHFY